MPVIYLTSNKTAIHSQKSGCHGIIIILTMPMTAEGKSHMQKTPRQSVAFPEFFRPKLRTLHHVEEFIVGLGHRQLVDQELHRIDLTHRMNNLAQDPHLLQLFGGGEQLFFTGT